MSSHSDPPRPRSLSMHLDEVFTEDLHAEPVTAFLVGLTGNLAGKLFKVRAGESLIGRTSRGIVPLQDEKSVSHHHAKLILSAAGCTIEDAGSTNGTFVNNAKIEGAQELHAGDIMRFGQVSFGFLTDAADQEQHTRALARVTQSAQMLPAAGGGTAAFTQARGGIVVAADGGAVVSASGSMAPSALATSQQNGLDKALDIGALVMAYVRRYWLLVALTMVTCAALGAATVAVLPPKATAQFRIYLRQVETEGSHFSTFSTEFAGAEFVFADKELVKKTLEDMGKPTTDIKATSKALSFTMQDESTYRGAFSHLDHRFAESFLAHHLKNYLEQEIRKSIKVLANEAELLRTQFEKNEKTLKEGEAKLREFKKENLDALPELAAGQITSIVTLESQRDLLDASVARNEQQLALAEQQLASEDAFVVGKVQSASSYETGLMDVRRRIAAAESQGLAAGHPELEKLRSEEQALIRLRDSTISAETTDTERRANPEHRRLENRVAELRIAVNTSRQELSQVESRLGKANQVAGAMPQVEAQGAALQREVEEAKKLRTSLFERLKAKELDLQFERASIAARYEILEPPTASPARPMFTAGLRGAIGMVLGVFLGVFLAGVHWLRGYAASRTRRLNTAL